MNFGQAFEQVKQGKGMRLPQWKTDVVIRAQYPDEHSKMTQPYIYIDTTDLVTNNLAAPKGRVPWLASQTDMLAEDWETV